MNLQKIIELKELERNLKQLVKEYTNEHSIEKKESFEYEINNCKKSVELLRESINISF